LLRGKKEGINGAVDGKKGAVQLEGEVYQQKEGETLLWAIRQEGGRRLCGWWGRGEQINLAGGKKKGVGGDPSDGLVTRKGEKEREVPLVRGGGEYTYVYHREEKGGKKKALPSGRVGKALYRGIVSSTEGGGKRSTVFRRER